MEVTPAVDTVTVEENRRFSIEAIDLLTVSMVDPDETLMMSSEISSGFLDLRDFWQTMPRHNSGTSRWKRSWQNAPESGPREI